MARSATTTQPEDHFTQTDPTPYGAGSSFEGSYVYGGSSPSVNVDPSGLRFSNALSTGRGRDLANGQNFKSDWAGRQILTWWLTGRGQRQVIRDDGPWTGYLQDSFANHLESGGDEVSQIVSDSCGALLSGRSSCRNQVSKAKLFNFAFDNGEGIVGYNYLHGPSDGFRFHSVVSHSSLNGKTTVDYSVSFRDRVDPNPQYSTDTSKSTFAKGACALLWIGAPVCRPTNYDIDLTWVQRFELSAQNGKFVATPVVSYGGLQNGPPTATPPNT